VTPRSQRGARRRARPGLADRLPRHTGLAATFLLFGAVAAAGIVRGGHYDAFVEAHGTPRDVMARAIGLGISTVTISGLVEMHEHEVLAAAGIDPRGSLAFLNVEAAREKLEKHPLVAEASVRKLYPDALTVRITERDPFALWQKDGAVHLIGPEGQLIDRLRDERFAKLPFVVGAGANEKARDFVALTDNAPRLKPHIVAGSLVAGRRWNINLAQRVVALLPEEAPEEALITLEKLVVDDKILERGILTIDLRLPDRIAFRLTEEAHAAWTEEAQRRQKRLKGGTT
jgi:cell division protein FtsQ